MNYIFKIISKLSTQKRKTSHEIWFSYFNTRSTTIAREADYAMPKLEMLEAGLKFFEKNL